MKSEKEIMKMRNTQIRKIDMELHGPPYLKIRTEIETYNYVLDLNKKDYEIYEVGE